MYLKNINRQKESSGGSNVFFKNLRGPIKRTLGSPRLHSFVEGKSSIILTTGKKRHLNKMNDSSDRKLNKKRAKTSAA